MQTLMATDSFDFRLAADGDVRAFERIYDRHVGRIQRVFRQRCPPADAEDLAQEVFIRAWQKLQTFRGESAVATWLHRIAANLAIDAGRAARARPVASAPAETSLQYVRAPFRSMVDRLALSRAVDKLPPASRRVFVLHDLEGHNHQEIARLLCVPVGTSKARLHRARRALRRELGASRVVRSFARRPALPLTVRGE